MASAMSAVQELAIGEVSATVGVFTLAMEDVASHSLSNSHAEINVEADSSDPHSSIFLIGGYQIGIIVAMVVMGMTSMAASLCLGATRHGGRGNVSHAMGCGGPIEG